MDKYREKLRLNMYMNIAAVVILLAVQILGFCRVIRPVTAESHWADMWNGFITGAAAGIMALLIIGIIITVRALRSEKQLKKLYIKENDERSQQIAIAARSAGAQMFLITGIVAGIVAGYFSVSVSIAIIACVTINAFMCAGFKVYYSRKF